MTTGLHREPRDRRTASSRKLFHDSDPERPIKVAPRKHSFYIHFPKDQNCEVCKRSKITRAPCRKRTVIQYLGQRNLATWLQPISKSSTKDVNLDTIIDTQLWYKILATQWIQSYPCKTKTSQETEISLRKFLEPSEKPKSLKLTMRWNFGKSCEDLSWNHRTSAHHRSETNGRAERVVRRIKERTSAGLLQTGMDEKWWAGSVERYCYLRNVQDLLADGKTLYERRFGEPFNGPDIPFGAMVEYHPISAKGQSRLPPFWREKFYQGYSSDTNWLREESGKEMWWLQILRSWEH